MRLRIEERGARVIVRIAGAVALAGLVAALMALAAMRTRGTPYPLALGPAVAGAAETAGTTAPAALKVWLVLALAIGAVAAWLRRRAPSLRVPEAALGAVVVLWTASYLALLALGPTGLYRAWVLRVLLAVALLLLVRAGRGRRTPAPARPQAGAGVAGLAFALALGPLVLMQLGSPVSPFMDVLPYVASTQKIVTFQFYDPFANDAAGHWAPTRQVLGCDAPFSLLALVAGTRAELAISALIVPAAALQLTALYLLGRAVHGPLAGGMAALFLLQTFVWRRTPDLRGTALAFALVAGGLAFLLAARRDRATRTVLGGLALASAVVVNPLIGGVGMQVASVAVALAWLDGVRPFWPAVVALAGASLLALPQVAIGLAAQVPVWTLPLAGVAGLAVLALAARLAAGARAARARRTAAARLLALLAVVLAVFYVHAGRSSEFFPDGWLGYAPLVLLAAPGVAVLASNVLWTPARWPAAAVPAVALLVGIIDHTVASPLRFHGTLEGRSLASEVVTKMTFYWWPYWLALLAGVAFARLPRRRATAPAVALALAVVLYPFHSPDHAVEFDTRQLSLAETWGHHLAHAAKGYHGGRPDRRWVLDDDWQALRDFFLDEIAAGRVDYRTHVLQVAPASYTVELALGTGISVDLVTPQHDPDSIWTVGGRIRGMEALAERMAARPPYVLLTWTAPDTVPGLADYERVFERPRQGLVLYRSRPRAPAA